MFVYVRMCIDKGWTYVHVHVQSTLLLLLMRLYDPCSGSLRLDGADLGGYDLRWLRGQFGYVPQEPRLFDRSVRDNLGFGLRAPPSPAALDASLRQAAATAFVSSLPGALDARVGGSNQHRLGVAQDQHVEQRTAEAEPAIGSRRGHGPVPSAARNNEGYADDVDSSHAVNRSERRRHLAQRHHTPQNKS